MEEDVAFAEGVEEGGGGAKGGDVDGVKRGEFEVGAVDLAQAHEAKEIDGAGEAKNVFVGQGQVVAQSLENDVVHAVLDLKPNSSAAADVAQLLLDFLEQVFRLLLVDVEIAVARDAKGVSAADAVAGEEAAGAELDDFAEENVAAVLGACRIDTYEAREDAGDGENANVALNLGSGGIIERDDDVEGLVTQLGKGVGLVDSQRGEYGENLLVEVVLDPGEFVAVELGGGFKDDALAGEGGVEKIAPAVVLILDEGGNDGVDTAQLFARTKPVEGSFAHRALDLLDEAGDADFEKLVEVGGDNGKELDAFEEGDGRVLGLLEDAAVKGEPGELAVEVGGLGSAGVRLDDAGVGVGHADAAGILRGQGDGGGGERAATWHS